MMQRVRGLIAAILLLICMVGCGTRDAVYLERTESETEQVRREIEEAGETAHSDSMSEDENDSTVADDENVTEMPQVGRKDGTEPQPAEECYVYVCGAVEVPGVYILMSGARIYEAIAQAGGLTENAGITAVNQAQEVYDGLMIYIPTKEEAAAYPLDLDQKTSGGTGVTTADSQGEQKADERVNLNTASETELMTLSGIGQTRAEAILAYRKEHGCFSSVEEIMNVDGIKEGLYNRIKDNIKVK